MYVRTLNINSCTSAKEVLNRIGNHGLNPGTEFFSGNNGGGGNVYNLHVPTQTESISLPQTVRDNK